MAEQMNQQHGLLRDASAGEMGDREICYTINYTNGDAAGGENGLAV